MKTNNLPRKMLFTFVLFISVSSKSVGQTLESISVFEKQNQDCLDKGEDMMGCSALYENQMDSMLNLAYNNLRKTLSQTEQDSLKTEEVNWLKKRDKEFKKIAKEETEELGEGEDALMATYQDEGNFIKARVIVLVKRLNTLSK